MVKASLDAKIQLEISLFTKFRLVIAVDSSGSVDEDLLSEFLSEVNFLMSFINNEGESFPLTRLLNKRLFRSTLKNSEGNLRNIYTFIGRSLRIIKEK